MSGIKTPPTTSGSVTVAVEITIGSYPGALTTPPEIILVTFPEFEEELEVGSDTETEACTSRIGAPRSIFPVANC